MLKEADEVVGALSALFGGGSQGLNLGNMTFANPGMASMLSGMSSLNPRGGCFHMTRMGLLVVPCWGLKNNSGTNVPVRVLRQKNKTEDNVLSSN